MTENIECKLEHFGIRVNNLENSTEFYEKIFGFQKIRETDKPDLQLRLATLQLGDFYIELLQPYTTKTEKINLKEEKLSELLRESHSHLAISVNSLADAYTKLLENNVKFATPFNTLESKNIFCYDLNGFLIEIKQK